MKKKDGLETWEDFEIFTSKGAKIKDPKITILDNSTFLFNAAFVHKVKMYKTTHLILGYSPTRRIVTFQFTSDPKAEGALTIVHREGSSSVGSRSFFNFFFINVTEVAGRYEPKKIKLPKIGDVWAIDLNNKLPGK